MIRISEIPVYDFDVIIIGAGPGGSTLATYLAKEDISVLLIDSQSFPRDKVCGDFVGPVAIAELQKLGIAGLDAFPQTNLINRASVFLDGQEIINQPIPRINGIPFHGRVIPRITLDNWIFEKAKDRGVSILENTRLKNFRINSDGVKVEISGSGKVKTLKSKIIIGADGSNSTVARIFYGSKPSNFDRILAVRAYYKGIEGPEDRCDLYFTQESFPGYYWLFPTGKGNANIGVGMVLETLPKNKIHLNELLQSLIKKDRSLSRRIGNGKLEGKIVGWPLATYNPNKDLIDDRILLSGDAAGLINSLNGEGIQYAMLSARWAAQTIIECVRQDDFSKEALKSYERIIEKELYYDLSLSNFIVQLIRTRMLNPFWMEMLTIMVTRARQDESYAEIAGGILAGMQPANKALAPSFIAKTIMQGAVHFGIKSTKSVLQGPSNWLNLSKSASQFITDMSREIKTDPKGYSKWIMGLANNGIEISSHILKDVKNKITDTSN